MEKNLNNCDNENQLSLLQYRRSEGLILSVLEKIELLAGAKKDMKKSNRYKSSFLVVAIFVQYRKFYC